MSDLSLRQAQAQVDEWVQRVGHGYWSPHEMLARLTEEVGEVARLVNHRYGPKPKKPGEAEQEMGDELADVLFAVICLANAQGIDLSRAFEQMMAKYDRRDGERFQSSELEGQ